MRKVIGRFIPLLLVIEHGEVMEVLGNVGMVRT